MKFDLTIVQSNEPGGISLALPLPSNHDKITGSPPILSSIQHEFKILSHSVRINLYENIDLYWDNTEHTPLITSH